MSTSTSDRNVRFFDILANRTHWKLLHQRGDHQGVRKIVRESHLEDVSWDALPTELQLKLRAPGRDWEARLAHLAHLEKMNFFRLGLQMPLHGAAQIIAEIENTLLKPRPWGALLFCEMASVLEIHAGQWTGNYYFVLLPDRKPEDLRLEFISGLKCISSSIL